MPKHKALVMFIVINNKALKYLIEMFVKVEEINPYNLRNREVNVYLPRPHTENLKKKASDIDIVAPNYGIPSPSRGKLQALCLTSRKTKSL